MMNTAICVPQQVSGVSGVCPGYFLLPGRRKARTVAALLWSVRGVQGNSYCLTCARARAITLLLLVFILFLGCLFYVGHPGQTIKGTEIVKGLLSGGHGLPRTDPGHPGQRVLLPILLLRAVKRPVFM